MYFQNYDYAVRSGAEKIYQALDHIQEILSLWKVITGLCCLFCLCLYYFLLSSVSRFGHPLLMHVLYYIFLPLFTTKSDTFFLLPHHTKC